MQQDQWHYRDERSGKRLGPVNREQIAEMIAADRIERSTLVWHPTMAQWEEASTTDLSILFGDGPPPLPASEINRWAVYALALFPLVGLTIQAVASAVLSARSGQNVQHVFDHDAWLLLFIIGNGVLGDLDQRNLRHAGLKLRGATVIAALLAPVYVFVSCRTFKRHAGHVARYAYLPFLIFFALAVRPRRAADLSPGCMVLTQHRDPDFHRTNQERTMKGMLLSTILVCASASMPCSCRAMEGSRCSAPDVIDAVKSLAGEHSNNPLPQR